MTGRSQPPLLALLACASLAACGGAPTRPVLREASSVNPAGVTLYLVKRGWHVDIGIAVTDLQQTLQSVGEAFGDSRYLLFGFGDRRYLLQGGAGNMIGALWGGAGLVLVTATGARRPEDVFGEESVVRLSLTAQQMSALQEFISHSLTRRDGTPVRVEPGPHGGGSYSGYYESVQHYSGLHTCNTWVAEALQSAGLPISSSGVEFADQLWRQVQHLRSEAGAAPPPAGLIFRACPRRCPG